MTELTKFYIGNYVDYVDNYFTLIDLGFYKVTNVDYQQEEVKLLREVYLSPEEVGVEIRLDELVGVSYFVEIEAPTTEKIWELATKLQLTKEQLEERTYAQLIKEVKG